MPVNHAVFVHAALVTMFSGCARCQDQPPPPRPPGDPEPRGGERGDPKLGAPDETCERDFIGQRQNVAWYGSHQFQGQVACTAPRKKTINELVSVPVYYVDVGANWTNAQAAAKVDEAKAWFRQYCVTLQVHTVVLRDLQKQTLTTALRDGDVGKAEYAKAVADVYKVLWTERMGRPRDFVLLLFVDNFTGVDYGDGRVNAVSGNFQGIPVALITARDQGAPNIVTHELVHAFGKTIGASTSDPPGSRTSCSNELNNTWNEAPCDNDMGKPKRAGGAGGAFNNPNTDIVDWASYWDWRRCNNIR